MGLNVNFFNVLRTEGKFKAFNLLWFRAAKLFLLIIYIRAIETNTYIRATSNRETITSA